MCRTGRHGPVRGMHWGPPGVFGPFGHHMCGSHHGPFKGFFGEIENKDDALDILKLKKRRMKKHKNRLEKHLNRIGSAENQIDETIEEINKLETTTPEELQKILKNKFKEFIKDTIDEEL